MKFAIPGRANGSRQCAPDDRLRANPESLHRDFGSPLRAVRTRADGRAPPPRPRPRPRQGQVRPGVAQCDREISRSSSFFPLRSCARTQCGCKPRPDQVSEGRSGFRYFGSTLDRDAAAWHQFQPSDAAFHAFHGRVSWQGFHEGFRARPRVRRRSSWRDQYPSHFVSRFGFKQRSGGGKDGG
jgi:hypothetical protein